MEDLVPIVALISVFGGGILFVKVLTDYFLKRNMIDKGLANEEAAHILRNHGGSKYAGLKWGLLSLSAGIGLMIIHYLPYDGDTPFPYGVLAICISLGFLLYYFLVKDKTED